MSPSSININKKINIFLPRNAVSIRCVRVQYNTKMLSMREIFLKKIFVFFTIQKHDFENMFALIYGYFTFHNVRIKHHRVSFFLILAVGISNVSDDMLFTLKWIQS